MFTPINCKDIHILIYHHFQTQKMLVWNSFNHRNRRLNPTCTKIHLPAAIGRPQCNTFIRLRIGHTEQTHEHLSKGQNSQICSFCGGHPNIIHLLNDGPGLSSLRSNFFGPQLPIQALECPSAENIKKCTNTLKKQSS